MMRKPRDFDTELKALNDRARKLKDRKQTQLGDLVIATGGDTLPVELLAGALLAAVETKDAATKEAWRKRGAAFFQQSSRRAAGGAGRDSGGGKAGNGGSSSSATDTGAQ